MRKRLTKVGAAIAALATLAVGGSALASAAGSGSQPAKAPAVVQKANTEAENPASDPTGKADTDSIQGENGADDASEPAENEAAEPEESGSEVPGDDGPGGHADEPGNPSADTQQEGQN